MNKNKVQQRKQIGKDDVLDRVGSTELAANLFRITQTDEKLKREQVKGEGIAVFTHLVVGEKVRESIKNIGGTILGRFTSRTSYQKIGAGEKKAIEW